jgi:predicted NAD/FAD-binding protein
MVMGILRFYKEAPQVLHAPEVWEGMTLGDYLELERYSRPFVEDHLLPMAAAIWSSPATDIRAFPLEMFLRFFQNHGLLQRHNRPQWRTVEGGSRAYIERLRAAFSPRVTVLKDTPTVRVWRQPGQVGVKDSKDNTIFYEQVVLACHADEAFSMLQDADAQERSILSVFPYTPNEAVLHSDTRLMPRNRRVWSSWNYRRTGRNNPNVDVTYWMNRLQGQPDSLPLFVSLNPDPAPDPSLVHGRWTYHHPAYNRKSLRTQKQLHRIQGKRNTWFCGAWCGYGFHEDGLSSALAVVEGIQATGMEKQAA